MPEHNKHINKDNKKLFSLVDPLPLFRSLRSIGIGVRISSITRAASSCKVEMRWTYFVLKRFWHLCNLRIPCAPITETRPQHNSNDKLDYRKNCHWGLLAKWRDRVAACQRPGKCVSRQRKSARTRSTYPAIGA